MAILTSTEPGRPDPRRSRVRPEQVRDLLGRHLLVDGYHLVVDLDRSQGTWLIDARDGTRYLDFYTFFGSQPLGFNHPALVEDPEFRSELAKIALHKPANSDVYTVALAQFVDTFSRVLGDSELPHLFFVEGGAMAVENALKVAFDWKSRRNEAAGRGAGTGGVLHLRHAFHGRSGYTMSLTNTEPAKTDRFPQFDWPRIDSPALQFPLTVHEAANRDAEAEALAQARAAFEAHPHAIACFLAEPIQGEGGDRHLSSTFLSQMEDLCRRHDALFVLDEVQTGVGLTGHPWAYQALGLRPDIVAFAKKVQVGGIMAGRRVDEVTDNVFHVSGRINSTWGGGLVDMVRSARILEVIERDGLMDNAAEMGTVLLSGLEDIAARHPSLVANARGRGLMCAVDLAEGKARDAVLRGLREGERVLALGCGERSIRFRPPLTVGPADVASALAALERVVQLSQRGGGRA